MIYMDNHATTRVDPRVVEAMLPFFSEDYGNAASGSHAFGWKAADAVKKARTSVASMIGAKPAEIVFTSGATESNNIAILGLARSLLGEGKKHLITQQTEHKSVLDIFKALEKEGCEVTRLKVDETGQIRLEDLESAIRPETALVSIMFANNEIGTFQPVTQIGELCRKHEIYFHCDAAQAAGKTPIDVKKSKIDLLSISGHKFYAPKGVGALYKNAELSAKISPIVYGGGQEGGVRSGTLNVPSIVGLGVACDIVTQEMPNEIQKVQKLRDRLFDLLSAGLDKIQTNGHPEERLAGNLNLSFEKTEGDALVMVLRGVALSTGSACGSTTIEPSHVLRALPKGAERAISSVRFGIGRFTTIEEIEAVATMVIEAVKKQRRLG